MNQRYLLKSLTFLLATSLLLAGCASTNKNTEEALTASLSAEITAAATPEPESTSNANVETDQPSQDSSQPTIAPTETPVSLAPDFTLKDKAGTFYTLSQYTGKVVVLNFWASWCPPCKAEMPELEALNIKWREEHSKEDGDKTAPVFLTINMTDGMQETKEKALKFLSDNKYTFTTLFDEESNAAIAYEIYAIPTTVIIGKDGAVFHRTEGQISGSTLENLVAEALAQ